MTPELKNLISPIPPVLDGLRGNIDRIDDQILDLLEQRYALVKRIAWAKTRAGETALAIRPRREASILERLWDRAIHVPSADIEQIWRSILSLSAHHQRAYRVLVAGPETARLALMTLAATRYGASVPIDWTDDLAAAVELARQGDVVLLIAADTLSEGKAAGLDLIAQTSTDSVAHPWAVELGCLGRGEKSERAWSPSSWRSKAHRQQPAYSDRRLAAVVEHDLSAGETLVPMEEVTDLKALIAEAQQGRRLLIQAGDCAEAMDAGRDDVLAMAALIDSLGQALENDAGLPAVRLGRIGGQFAKPRSRAEDEVGLPAYRGDAVNGRERCEQARRADPYRLLLARAQTERVRGWLAGTAIHTSHEGLLLGYEAALTRQVSGRAWAGSAHSLWLGERTRQLSGAHVEYLRGIANPIGIKCGPTLSAGELLALIDRLDPEREAGRLMLVARMGASDVKQGLPALMGAVQESGHRALWLCDPMHGNNRTVNGSKVRLLPEIVAEVEAFVGIARSLGVHPGGLHLEVTPQPVRECVEHLNEAAADRQFESLCDPRLNPAQAARVVAAYTAALGGRS